MTKKFSHPNTKQFDSLTSYKVDKLYSFQHRVLGKILIVLTYIFF